MAGGRPTKLNDELMAKARSYITEFYKQDDLIPSIASLCVYLGVARSTIHKWGDENPKFSDILEDLKAMQEKTLLTGGMSGNFNSTIAKLVLTKHGYSDKQEVKQDGGLTITMKKESEASD